MVTAKSKGTLAEVELNRATNYEWIIHRTVKYPTDIQNIIPAVPWTFENFIKSIIISADEAWNFVQVRTVSKFDKCSRCPNLSLYSLGIFCRATNRVEKLERRVTDSRKSEGKEESADRRYHTKYEMLLLSVN